MYEFLFRQKQELAFAEWNAYGVANGMSPLDPVYLQYMCGRERALWKLVDQMAKAITKPYAAYLGGQISRCCAVGACAPNEPPS